MTLRVRSGLLPEDASARHARLRDYFCDKDASAVRVDGGWELDLAWPGGVERHVDTQIRTNLSPWAPVELPEMATARWRAGRVLTAFYDTWTLYAWSEWIAKASPRADQQITILHIDDHRDLGSPRLAVEGDGLVDLITGKSFDLGDPASVLAACESGAVGMGSFLTPFLHAFPHCDVRQLCQPPKVTETVDHVFRLSMTKDDLLRPGADRPSVVLERAEGVGPGRYRATNDLTDWLAGIDEGPVLLHVDMDYFNNRYDGDGDWLDRRRRHDPSLDEVLKRVDEVTAAIATRGLTERIEDAVVAFSPGFFPAEMWSPSEARLRAGLLGLYE